MAHLFQLPREVLDTSCPCSPDTDWSDKVLSLVVQRQFRALSDEILGQKTLLSLLILLEGGTLAHGVYLGLPSPPEHTVSR